MGEAQASLLTPPLGLANRGNVETIGFYGGSRYALSRPRRVAGRPVPGRLWRPLLPCACGGAQRQPLHEAYVVHALRSRCGCPL